MSVIARWLRFLLIVVGLAKGSDVPGAAPPNFIVILCDDLGYGDVGCFGAEKIRTPRVDRMATEGMRFTDFYAPSPLCSPSRAGLLTGCYPRRVGLAKFVLRPDATTGIHPDEVTIAELLKGRGYATCAIGKWHVGFLPPFRPGAQGFDYYFGIYHNLDHWETKHFEGQGGVPLLRNEEVVLRPATPEILTERYTEEALGFIERNRERPFFIYLAHTMPHLPYDVTPRFNGRSAGGLYGDVVECLDWSTGEILDGLVRLGLDKRTIVVFTSDNGPDKGSPGSAGSLRGQKHTVFEGGMRVPCVMWGPGQIPAGSVCNEVASTIDLLPTFGAMAGAPPPRDRVIDGRDIRALLFGEVGARSPHEAFFFHDGNGVLRAVRSGRWKLHVSPKQALYDLGTEIGEQADDSAAHPEVVARLRGMFDAFELEIGVSARPVGRGE
ncbi:MAG TPA: sulfatase [Verrucomicrobiae bacterium]|nr:sulfatase [Verrucomicrobiae bacterium]